MVVQVLQSRNNNNKKQQPSSRGICTWVGLLQQRTHMADLLAMVSEVAFAWPIPYLLRAYSSNERGRGRGRGGVL